MNEKLKKLKNKIWIFQSRSFSSNGVFSILCIMCLHDGNVILTTVTKTELCNSESTIVLKRGKIIVRIPPVFSKFLHFKQ